MTAADAEKQRPGGTMRRILSLSRRAIEDYDMIEDGDHIAVGVSGGKDSLALLCLLAELRAFYTKKFEVSAVIIDMGLDAAPDFSQIEELCHRLKVPLTVHQTDIGHVVFHIRKEKNPCSLCANMRRGALNNVAARLGCNKIALGHHYDDALETFFMSLFQEGRIACFSPVTYLSRMDLTMIRPMIYIPETVIISFANRASLPIYENPCPANHNTNREKTKQFIAQMAAENEGFKENIFGAIQRGQVSGFRETNRCKRKKSIPSSYKDE